MANTIMDKLTITREKLFSRRAKLQLIYQFHNSQKTNVECAQVSTNVGPTLRFVLMPSGAIIGGYMTIQTYQGAYKQDLNSFLFRISANGDVSKFNANGQGTNHVYWNSDRAFSFGDCHTLHINLEAPNTNYIKTDTKSRFVGSNGGVTVAELLHQGEDITQISDCFVVRVFDSNDPEPPAALNTNTLANIRNQLRNYSPSVDTINLKHLNILLLGQRGSGKSSFTNTLLSAFEENDVTDALVRPSPNHVTTKVYCYDASTYGNLRPRFGFKIWDLWGSTQTYEQDVRMMVSGRIQQGTNLQQTPQLQTDNSRQPSFNDEMHCALVMLTYGVHDEASYPDEITQLRNILTNVCDPVQLPVIVLLTQCDRAADVGTNLEGFTTSDAILIARTKVATSFGIDIQDVIPISTSFRANVPLSQETKLETQRIALGVLDKVTQKFNGLLRGIVARRVSRNNVIYRQNVAQPPIVHAMTNGQLSFPEQSLDYRIEQDSQNPAMVFIKADLNGKTFATRLNDFNLDSFNNASQVTFSYIRTNEEILEAFSSEIPVLSSTMRMRPEN